ncbi:hypothetical protein ABT364_18785 [Massilia sp. SR12]
MALVLGAGQAMATGSAPAWLPAKQKMDAQLAAERGKLKVLAPQAQQLEQTQDALSGMLQMAGNFASFAGDTEGAMAAFDEQDAMEKTQLRADNDDFERLAEASAQDAIQAIVAEARQRQVVILNEAHHVPLHRAFAMRLARELRKIGYAWLACEGFSETPMAGGYIGRKSGYYTQEPAFANFIRDAALAGWKLMPYEHIEQDDDQPWERRIENREAGQARKLAERIFSVDPKAKVFIYVGYGHVRERPAVGHGIGTALMAAQLKHRTGIDPLTIDQTGMMAHTRTESEHPIYAKALTRADRSEPFVLRAAQGGYQVFGQFRYGVDMQVVHPRYAIDPETGRPHWLASLSGYTPRQVPAALLPSEGRRIVAARLPGQPDDSIPADVLTLEANKPAPHFMLPPGEYTFSIYE